MYDFGVFVKGKLYEVVYFKGKFFVLGMFIYRERLIYRSMGLVVVNDVLIDGESFRIEFGYDKLNCFYYIKYFVYNFIIK